MITLRLVKTCYGTYAGQDFSSRWNAATLKTDFGIDINTMGFTAYRAAVRALGFKDRPFAVNTSFKFTLTAAEQDATAPSWESMTVWIAESA